jgi:hypothetical protein
MLLLTTPVLHHHSPSQDGLIGIATPCSGQSRTKDLGSSCMRRFALLAYAPLSGAPAGFVTLGSRGAGITAQD